MDINQLKGNSNASRRVIEQTPEIGNVRLPEGRRVEKSVPDMVFSSILAESASKIFTDVLKDVILPAGKNLLLDVVTTGMERALFGESRGRYSSSSRLNYSGIYSNKPSGRVIRFDDYVRRDGRDRGDFSRPSYEGKKTSYQDVAFTYGEAEDILFLLREKESQYGLVSISDMYDAIKEVIGEDLFKDVREFTDNQWGWSDISYARKEKVANGYVLKMPRVEPL